MTRNYYAILGVLPTATLDEIRSAYRNRAKQFHPDRYGENSVPFLRVQEAYDVLGDPESRSTYDHSLRGSGINIAFIDGSTPVEILPRKPTVEQIRDPRRSMELGTIFPQISFRNGFPSFDEIFDELWNELNQPPVTKSEKHRTLTMEVLLTPDQAHRGGMVRINIPIEHACPACHGRGDIGPFECWRCAGTGSAPEELSLEVEYPPGIRDFYRVALPLDHYGIHNVCPVLLFRISTEGYFEDLS
jgi:molecular chaperone DnaJ